MSTIVLIKKSNHDITVTLTDENGLNILLENNTSKLSKTFTPDESLPLLMLCDVEKIADAAIRYMI